MGNNKWVLEGEVPSSPVVPCGLTRVPFVRLCDSYGEQRVAMDAIARVVGGIGNRPTIFCPLFEMFQSSSISSGLTRLFVNRSMSSDHSCRSSNSSGVSRFVR